MLILASMKTSRVEPMGAEKAEVSRYLLTFFIPRVTSACALSLCAGSQNVHIFIFFHAPLIQIKKLPGNAS